VICSLRLRTLTVGFFRFADPVADQLREKLNEFAAIVRVSDGSRTAVLSEDLTVLMRAIWMQEPGRFLVDFSRIRDGRNVHLGDVAGNERSMSIGDARMKPTDRCAAMLDLSTQVLAVQENASGVTYASIARYFHSKIPVLGRLRFLPIVVFYP